MKFPCTSQPPRDVQRLLPMAVISSVLLFSSAALACEKHINGHQTGSDTAVEAASR